VDLQAADSIEAFDARNTEAARSPEWSKSGYALAVGVAAVGALLLLESLALSWFRVPEGVPGVPTVVGREAPATATFKIVCVLGLATILGLARVRATRRRAAEIAAAMLAVLLLYPHAVMVWCPATAERATDLFEEHANLASGGGDVFVSDENKMTGWKDRVYVPDTLPEATVTRVPSLTPQAVPFGQPRHLLEWFGYSNAFCFFSGAGWPIAIAGAVSMLIGLCRRPTGIDLGRSTAAARAGASSLVVLGLAALAPAAGCAIEIERARDALELGATGLSLERLQWAAHLVPAVRRDSGFLEQIGMMQSRLGIDSAEARLHRAIVLQRQGEFEPADALLASVAGEPSAAEAVRREAARGLLRRGIRSLNSGELANATDTLEAVLRVDPTNLKANYALEIAYLRASRFDAVPALAERVRGIYHYIGTVTKVSVLGANDENLAMAAYLRGDALEAHRAWQKLSDPKSLRTEP
jgi:hypothetical protein